MKGVIEIFRKLLKDGVFSDEQHVSFSLVGRIYQKIEWNIWKPDESFAEYKIEKVQNLWDMSFPDLTAPPSPPPGESVETLISSRGVIASGYHNRKTTK